MKERKVLSSFVLDVNPRTGRVNEINGHAKRVASVLLQAYSESNIGGPGGMIVCAITVNAMAGSGFMGKLKGWASTMLNRFFRNKHTDEEVMQSLHSWNKRDPGGDEQQLLGTGWSVGNLFKGHYYDAKSGQTFNDDSFTVDIRGVPLRFVKEVGAGLARKFKQQSVLIVDHKTGHVSLVFP
jgi:hypothetical protein